MTVPTFAGGAELPRPRRPLNLLIIALLRRKRYRQMPMLPRGIAPRFLTIRSFFTARPVLPVSSRLAVVTPASRFPRWSPHFRAFQYSPLRTNSPPLPPSSPSSSSSQTPDGGEKATLSQRLRHLIKSYGWYALGVYTVLTVLDFGVAFAGINIIGAEKVSHYTHIIKDWFTGLVFNNPTPPEPGRDEMDSIDANANKGGREGLYAMLILAYTVHKTLFLPIRVGLTAAITPRLVGWLRARGWAGGAGTMRAAREMRERVRHRRDSRD